MERKRKKTKKKGKLHWGDAGTHETRGGSVFFFEEVRGRGRGSLSFFKDRLDGSVEHVATSCRLIRALSREKGEVRRSVGDARGRGRGKQCFETLWKKFESTYSYIRVFYLFVHPFFSPFFLHYSSFMEVCTKTRWATFIEINVSKVFYFYIESSKV